MEGTCPSAAEILIRAFVASATSSMEGIGTAGWSPRQKLVLRTPRRCAVFAGVVAGGAGRSRAGLDPGPYADGGEGGLRGGSPEARARPGTCLGYALCPRIRTVRRCCSWVTMRWLLASITRAMCGNAVKTSCPQPCCTAGPACTVPSPNALCFGRIDCGEAMRWCSAGWANIERISYDRSAPGALSDDYCLHVSEVGGHRC